MTMIDTAELASNCYENVSQHVVGVIKLREYDGKPNGIGVKPGDRVWLNTVEIRLTGNAPKRAEDNPLANGELNLVNEDREAATAELPSEVPTEEVPEVPAAPETKQEPSSGADSLQPHPDLPTGAIPGQQDPRVNPAPVQTGSLEEVAAEAAAAAEETGVPPTEETAQTVAAEETAVSQVEETGVKIDTPQEKVVGERAQAEEVATPTTESKTPPKPPRQRNRKGGRR